jgi:hypothetical protein
MKIEYDAAVRADAGQWYGQMIVSNLRYTDGSQVQVNRYLSMTFNSPAAIHDTDIPPQLATTWVSTQAHTNSVSLGTDMFSVSLELDFETPHQMDPHDQITIDVNGDLTQHADLYLNSFVIAATNRPT